jgi:release factor glutamine methyltransferase
MRSVELSSADLEVLVARLRAAGCVFAEEEAALLAAEAPGPDALERAVVRRVDGEPLELVLGWAEFCGLRLAVAPGVFVPRRRTELLVRVGAAGLGAGDVVVDVGCGTGAVAAALGAAVRGLDLHAVDVDPAAVELARRNLPGAGVREGDLLDPLPRRLRGRVALLAANTPYVPSDEVDLMPREARDHEHLVALDGGSDGVAVQRRLLAQAPAWLAPGGRVVVETGRRQVDLTVAAARAAGLAAEVVTDDEVDGTVVIARAPG